jgi:hypothetical protein
MKLFLKNVIMILLAEWISCCLLNAQSTPRNLLSHFSKEEIAQSLIPLSQWHPFPKTAKEWRDIMPDTIRQKIIAQAEEYSTTPFPSLPASLMLEYVRTGNRSNYELYHFKNVINYLHWCLPKQLNKKVVL